MNKTKGYAVKLLTVLAAICLLTALFLVADTGLGILPAAFAESGGHSDDHNNEGDGNKIESIHIHWVTYDTVNDSAPDNLYLRTSSSSELTMQYQIDVSFSGQYDYEPGAIRITIPPQIWHQRDLNSEEGGTLEAGYGSLSLSVPDASITSTDWHYEINEDGTYSIVNTKTIAATSKAMFQFTIRKIFPQYLVDEKMSDELMAHCEVVTHEGNTIWLDSNTLTAQVDTQENLSHAYKNGELYEDPDSVPAALLEMLPAGSNPKDYIYVKWRTYPQYSGNQYFSLDVQDNGSVADGGEYSPEADLANYVGCYRVVYDEEGHEQELVWTAPAVMLGENGKGSVNGNVWTKDVLTNTWNNNGTASYNNACTIWTAYSTADMEWDTTYRLLNKSTWTLTEFDPEADYPDALGGTDPQRVTMASATSSVTYTRAKWQYPPGRFMVFKYTEQTETHKHNTISSDSNRSSGYHRKDYTYEMALNHLRKGQDVDMQYEVLSVGYGYIFTCGPLANAVSWQDINGVTHTAALDKDLDDDHQYDENWNSAAWADDPDHYLNWYYVMDTTDRWNWFQDVSGTPESQLIKANSDDYEFLGVTIASPEMFDWDRSKNPTYYYSSQGSTFGFIPDESIPKPAVELWVELNNDAADESGYAVNKDGWVYVGSYTVQSGKTQYIDFQALGLSGVTGYRTRIASNQAATKLAVYPHIRLKASERVMNIVEDLFAESETPSTTYRNDDMMYVDLYHHAERTEVGVDKDVHPNQAVFLDEDIYTHQYIWQDNSRATLTGAGYGVVPNKSIRFDSVDDNDVVNRQVVLHYSAYVDEMTNLTSVANWREAVELGAVKEEKSGIWYDLLPEGVIPLTETVKLRDGDSINYVRTYDNWRDTGRILMVVDCTLKATPRNHTSSYVSDRPTLTFDATYSWTDINTLGGHLVNYVAFESGDDEQLGTLSGRIGEPDAMVRRNNNYTPNREPANIVEALSNLDPDSDEARFVYAKADVNLTVDQMAQTEYVKNVKSDLDGIWTQGLTGQTQVNVYEGQTYTYRLRVASAKDTITSNMVMYDSLENYLIPEGGGAEHDATKQADHDEVESKKDWDGDWDRKTVTVGAEGYEEEIEVGGQWRGRLMSIDLNEFIAKGCAPVIYYATQPWLQFGDTSGSTVDESIFFNYEGRYDLSDNSTWNRADNLVDGVWTVPTGVDVTAIALDLRKRTDGSEFQLKSQESGAAYLHMIAPDDHGDENLWHAKGAYAHINEDGRASTNSDIDWEAALDPDNNMHAYNNTRLICRVTYEDGGAYSYITMIRNDYTRVGIMPQIIRVEKVWNDDDNHDGKRPESITVTIKRKAVGAAGDYEVVCDETTGEPLTVELNEANEWSGLFVQVDVVDENGTPYLYTFDEEKIEGYTGSVTRIDDTHFTLTNHHENEKIQISGEKQWLMPDGSELPDEAENLKPAKITVNVYRTGSDGEKVFVTSKNITPDADTGEWHYLFTNLDKYERGGFEYIYSVAETPVEYFWSSTSDESELPDGYTVPFEYDPDAIDVIYNFYIPFGDLGVTKKIENTTSVSKEQEFTYMLSLLVQGNEEEVPVEDTFEYTIYDVTGEGVSTGTIGHGDSFTLKGDQRIVIKKLPSNAHYTLHEEDVTGWTQTGSVNTEGRISTANEIAAEYTNTYSASGNANVKINKKLTGHVMVRNKFRFDLVDDNPDSAMYGEVIRPGYSPAVTGERDPEDNSLEVTGEVAFAALSYTEADAGKTFQYIIREQIPAEATDNGDGTYTYQGYTYTKKDYPVKVEVVDNGDGTLEVTPYYQDDSEWKPGSEFTYELENSYEAEGEISFQAWKVLEVYDLEEGQFEFELYNYDEEAGDKVGDPIEVVSNDAEGIAHFSALHFDQNDVSDDPNNPREYLYLIREKHGNDPTVIYSHKEYIIHVKPYDNNDGTLSFAQDNQTVEREYVETECPECHGTGRIGDQPYLSYSYLFDTPIEKYALCPADLLCASCHGSGYSADGQICSGCHGSGIKAGPYTPEDTPDGFALLKEITSQTRYANNWTNENLTYITSKPTLDTTSYTNAPQCRYVPDDPQRSRMLIYPLNKTNRNSFQIYTLGGEEDCSDCNGMGYTYTEGGITVSGETAGPVFTNGYRNGNLSVTKLTTSNDHPEQEFHFHIQLTGPNLEDGTIEYELDQVDSGTEHINGSKSSVQDSVKAPMARGAAGSIDTDDDSWITARPVLTEDDFTGKGVAVLTDDGVLIFFRTNNDYTNKATGDFISVDGKTYSGTIYTTVENRYTSDDNLFYWNTSGFRPRINEIKHVRMDGAVKVDFLSSFLRDAVNLETADLSKMIMTDADKIYAFVGHCPKLTTLNIANFGRFTRNASSFSPNISVVTLGDDTRFTTAAEYPVPPTTAPYDGLWHNWTTGETLTSRQLFTEGGHGGTWGWEEPAVYQISFLPGDGATGSMPVEQSALCGSDYTFKPTFYRFSHQITGMRDYDTGTFYPVDENGYVTIPALTYTKDQTVELTAEWERIDTSANMQNGRIDLILHGGEMATFKEIPAGTAYEVWEDTPEGWILISKVDDSGRIVPLETADAIFTNEYSPNKASASLTASKIFDGELTSRRFTFSLYEIVDGTENFIESKENTDGGVASFSVIVYDATVPGTVGTHNYIIRETVTNPDATITYDTHTEHIQVVVTDTGAGLVTAETTYLDGNGVFRNNTKPGNLEISKTTEGTTDASKSQVFRILVELTDKKGAPITGEFNATRTSRDGATSEETVSFTDGQSEISLMGSEILLIKDIPAGASYTLTEQELTGGWSQAEAEDDSGTIAPTETSTASFINTYAVKGNASLKAEKLVEGEIPEGFRYTFRLYKADEDWHTVGEALQTRTNNPVDLTETITVDDEETENPDYNKSMVLFNPVSFTQEGTYRYIITEDAEVDDPTIIPDSRVIKVTVEMRDEEGHGELSATVTYEEGESTDANGFLNRRKNGSLQISKEILSATEVSAEAEFSVTITLENKNGEAINRSFSAIRTDREGAEITESVEFTEGKAEVVLKGGESLLINGLPHGATYKLSESAPDGWTQTDASGVSGTIIGDQTSRASFTNMYDAHTELVLAVRKITDPANLEIPEGAFSFILKQNKSEIERVKNNADGIATFTPIAFTLNNVGETFTYTIQEQTSVNIPTEIQYAFDNTTYTVTVTVEDNGDGTLSAEPVYTKDNETVTEVVFTNSTRVDIPVRKVWEGDAAVVGKYRPARVVVQLLADGEAVATRSISAAAATAGDNNVWESMFTGMPEYRNGHKIEYTVQEQTPSNYAATVTSDGKTLVLINTFLEDSVTLGGKKIAKGIKLRDEAFSFRLEPPYGAAPMPENNIVTCDEDGNFSFGEITFLLSDLDTDDEGGLVNDTALTYRISEVIPEGAVRNEDGTSYILDDILYDPQVYDITVTLHYDEESKTLTAEADTDPEDVIFTNSREWTTLSVTKEWEGPAGGEVSLILYTVKNGEYIKADPQPEFTCEDGIYTTTVSLPTFDEAGNEIIYAVKEKAMDGYLTVYTNRKPYDEIEDAAFDGAVITNIYSPETVEATVKKIWDDHNDKAKKRPDSLTMILSNGTEHELNEGNGWTVTVTGLPKYDADGQEIIYSWKEGNMPDGYYMSKRSETREGTSFTNTLREETPPGPSYDYKFTFTKEWQGGKEQSISVTFYNPDGTVNSHGFKKKILTDMTWSYTAWMSQDKDYYVVENEIPGYKTKYVNTGKYADVTDRCYNGGKIINYKVTKTGDDTNLPLAIAMVVLSALGLVILIRQERKMRKQTKQ